MPGSSQSVSRAGPAPWAVALAFAVLYTTWGTTYFAIRVGVNGYHVPPGLFCGARVGLAGWILLAYLIVRGEPIRLPAREMFWIAVSGALLFMGGNGLITLALDRIPSGVAAAMTGATPVWTALLELFWPAGDRLRPRGWVGLAAGLAGVLLLLAPQLGHPAELLNDYWLVAVASNILWALGSLVVRHQHRSGSHLAAAAYQMSIGGMGVVGVGLAAGESRLLTAQCFSPGALGAFFYLLVAGSLVGFVAFNWLLGHVPAALVGTYAYVNPVVAIVVGGFLGHEDITTRILVGMLIILAGVALVRGAAIPGRQLIGRRVDIRSPASEGEEAAGVVDGLGREPLSRHSERPIRR